MSINEFVEITIFLCLICFSIYDKMQGFIDESGLFIFLFLNFFFFLAFYAEIQDARRYPVGQKFRRNRSILLRFRDKLVFAFNAEIQDGRQKWRENDF